MSASPLHRLANQRLLASVCFLLVILSGCERGQSLPGGYDVVIEGRALNRKAYGLPVYLTRHELPDFEPLGRDTFRVGADGRFSHTVHLNAPAAFEIDFGGRQEHLLILEKGDVEIVADGYEQSGTFDITGSPETNYFMAFYHLNKQLQHKKENLTQRLRLIEADGRIAEAYLDFMTESREEIRQFVDETEGSVVSIYALQFFTEAEYFTEEYDIAFLREIGAKAAERYPHSDFIQRFHESVESYRSTAVGETAPDFVSPELGGGELRLSDLRGKYVLLHFWASWNRSSREDFPELKQTYERFAPLGLEIVGVSLDKDQAAWREAVQAAELPWRNVSEAKFWDSEAVRLYHVEAIPSNVLIDRQGRIIGRDLLQDELDQRLRETFGVPDEPI